MIRSSSVDVLRGFALLGIAVVNLPYLALPLAANVAPPSGADGWAMFATAALFHGKFFVLFSFVFGWGFGVQLASAARASADPRSRYFSRLIALLLFGVAHALLVFAGDILVTYAVLGVALWPLRDASPRTLVRLAAATLPVAAGAFALLGLLATADVEDLAATGVDVTGASYLGTYADTVRQRLSEWPISLTVVALFNGPLVVGAFCLGLASFKAGFFEPDSAALAALGRRVPLLLALAVPANLAYAAAAAGFMPAKPLTLAGYAALAVGAPSLGAVYVWAVVRASSRLVMFAAVGTMPLTGYILQGLLAGLVFHGWGIGMFGRIGHAGLLWVSVGLWAATAVFAWVWLRGFARGPLDAALRLVAGGLAGLWPSRPGRDSPLRP